MVPQRSLERRMDNEHDSRDDVLVQTFEPIDHRDPADRHEKLRYRRAQA